GENQGIPYFLIFDKKGNLLSDSRMPAKDKKGNAILSNVGCPAQPDEVTFFTGLLKKTSTLTGPELDLIAKKFIKKPIKR
ncbi:MAG: hypothetical protein PHY99_10850, partial [Bacteroidales bacterium]|nr:hypothetical protein [Bacteroidales bacterium]